MSNNLKVLQDIHIIEDKGTKKHYCNNQLHRENGPAIEYEHGSREWYINGLLHREDGPAIETYNDIKEWYRNGKLHRDDGPAIEKHGDQLWYRDGKLHRKDGPAIEYSNGAMEWYDNGKRHREDGPAIQTYYHKKQWFLDDKEYTQDNYNAEISKRMNYSKLIGKIISIKESFFGSKKINNNNKLN